jgi:hypothetical protein
MDQNKAYRLVGEPQQLDPLRRILKYNLAFFMSWGANRG